MSQVCDDKINTGAERSLLCPDEHFPLLFWGGSKMKSIWIELGLEALRIATNHLSLALEDDTLALPGHKQATEIEGTPQVKGDKHRIEMRRSGEIE